MAQKETMYLFAESDQDSDSGMKISAVPSCWEFFMSEDAIKVGEVKVTYDLPPDLTADKLRKMAIETLKEKKQNVIATAYKEEQRLQGKIDKLLLLTHQGETE